MNELVNNPEDIETNILYFNNTLNNNIFRRTGLDLIQKGSCFIVLKNADSYNFYPSRFIGYKDNNFNSHKTNLDKDGRLTNIAIRNIFKKDPVKSDYLDEEYIKSLELLGIKPYHKKRKFWLLGDTLNVFDSQDDKWVIMNDDSEFPEGRPVEYRHLSRERNHKLISHFKDEYLKKYKNLNCQVCGFDFKKVYGEVGIGYIEAHHTLPVSSMTNGSKTKITDLAAVCSNCHRMLHRHRPWLSMRDLNEVLKLNLKLSTNTKS